MDRYKETERSSSAFHVPSYALAFIKGARRKEIVINKIVISLFIIAFVFVCSAKVESKAIKQAKLNLQIVYK